MASYRGHLAVSTVLGGAYTGVAMLYFGADWGTAALAGGLCALGGLLPDLDSQSGVPVRELFGLAAVVVPLMLLRRLIRAGLTAEQIFVIMGGIYLFIRFGVRELFKRLTVHRGMFHSIPAMVVAGLVVFLGYQHPALNVRLFLSVGVMIGFLSHLVLDEVCSVDLNGLVPKLNAFAGSAVKLSSKSVTANITCYSLLLVLSYLALNEAQQLPTHLEPQSMMEYIRNGRERRRQQVQPTTPTAVPALPDPPTPAPDAPPSPTYWPPQASPTPAPPVVSMPQPAWRPAPPLQDESPAPGPR
jgi:hypothetical protein